MLSAPFYLSSVKASVSKKHVVLVHGAWHGAWTWQETIPLLTQRGLSVSDLDLSGMGTTAHLQSLEIGLHTHGQDRTCWGVGGSFGARYKAERPQRWCYGLYLDFLTLVAGAGFEPATFRL